MAQQVKILFIDDNEDMQVLMEANIGVINSQQGSNYELVVAKSGSEGIKGMDVSPDVVLLDFSLPDMCSSKVFSKLRNINPNIPVIITSGYEESHIRSLFDKDIKFLWKLDWSFDNIQDMLVSVC